MEETCGILIRDLGDGLDVWGILRRRAQDGCSLDWAGQDEGGSMREPGVLWEMPARTRVTCEAGSVLGAKAAGCEASCRCHIVPTTYETWANYLSSRGPFRDFQNSACHFLSTK